MAGEGATPVAIWIIASGALAGFISPSNVKSTGVLPSPPMEPLDGFLEGMGGRLRGFLSFDWLGGVGVVLAETNSFKRAAEGVEEAREAASSLERTGSLRVRVSLVVTVGDCRPGKKKE